MSAAAPDYSDLYGSTELSDISMVLAEHAEHLNLHVDTDGHSTSGESWQLSGGSVSTSHRNRSSAGCSSVAPETKIMPGHSVVLYGCSSFCKAKLLHWKGDGATAS